MLNRVISVCLGSDSVASNNVCDLLEESRFALLLARAKDSEPGSDGDLGNQYLSAAEILQTATLGGARALGLQAQIGELTAGLQADFTAVRLDGPHQLPSYDPASTLVFSSSGRDVSLTVIAGREVYRDGHVTTVDEDRLRARMAEIAEKLRS